MSVKKLTIRFQVTTPEHINFEYFLKDLLNVSVLPALNAELVPLSLEVKNARLTTQPTKREERKWN